MAARLAIFTEEDARLQQCCGPDGAGFRNDDPYPARWCTASGCMAWRWFETHVRNSETPHPIPNVGPDELVLSGERYGFCGLAGSPKAQREA